ncbi:hypothetical protein Pcinc_009904 [Petrolisthes cinctipes]|uniref:DNA-directed RNA polymerase I subunit RPA34 n=1 Tax=Petrolisthes cinctipes TaxID=88211 RepID=A0AAE1G435_PETCI|nr:hypothetical protein Pcinc_009904 [Petrolisthes cinctipes]
MKRKRVSSDSEEETQQNEEQNSINSLHNEVLGKVVEDVSKYQVMRDPGALPLYQLSDPSTEVYLVTIPNDLLNPMKLVNTEMVFGGGKERELVLGKERYRVASYAASNISKPPSLFLPDMNGVLHKVADGKIRGHLALRGGPHEGPEEDKKGLERVDLDSLRSNTKHLPPEDLKPRNFFSSFMPGKSLSAGHGKARNKKKKREEENEDEVEGLPSEKKKVTQRGVLSKAGDVSREGRGGKKGKGMITEPEIREDLIGLSEGWKKDKKLRREELKQVKMEKEGRVEVLNDTFELTEGKKKENKISMKRKSFGGEVSMMKRVKIDKESEEEEERICLSQDLFAESPKKGKKSKKHSAHNDNSNIASSNQTSSQDMFTKSPTKKKHKVKKEIEYDS